LGITIPKADAYLAKWNSLDGQAKTNYGNSLSDPEDKDGNTDPHVINALANASLSAQVGAQILKEYYDSVKVNNFYNSHDPNNPITWSLALGCYNGGLSRATESYYKQPIEMQLYQVHALRFIMTAEIAAQLRNRLMEDPEFEKQKVEQQRFQIEKQLVSEEVDARAYAYSENDTGIKGITDYLKVWIPLSRDPIVADTTLLTDSLNSAYNAYPQSPYKYLISPGLRLWIVNGGYSQWDSVPSNVDHSNYPK